MFGGTRKMSGLLVAVAALCLPGCITIQAIEPVISPPATFKGDVAVAVEFVQPGAIGFRCAERGAKFFGLPGINSGACADSHLITMIDPCSTVTAGGYANALCSGLSAYRQETRVLARTAVETSQSQAPVLTKIGFAQPSRSSAATSRPPSPAAPATMAVKVEFVAPRAVEMRCAERGAKLFDAGDSFVACGDRMLVTMANPCDLETTGWYARTLCHEMAHVNGWASDHPVHGPLATIKLASQSPQAMALAAQQASSGAPMLVANIRDTTVSGALADAKLTTASLALSPEARKSVEDKTAAMIALVQRAAKPVLKHAASYVVNSFHTVGGNAARGVAHR